MFQLMSHLMTRGRIFSTKRFYQCNKVKQEIKSIQSGKAKIILSLFINYIIIYVQNLKELQKKATRTINTIKTQYVKLNMQNSIIFLYNSNNLKMKL